MRHELHFYRNISFFFPSLHVEIDRIYYRMMLDSWIKLARTGNARAFDQLLLVLEHTGRHPELASCKFHTHYSSSPADIVMKKLIESCASPCDIEQCLTGFDVLKRGKSGHTIVSSNTQNILFKALYLSSSFSKDPMVIYRRYYILLAELMVRKSTQISKISYCSIFHGLLNLFHVQNDRHSFELCLSCFNRMIERDNSRVPSADVILLEFLFTIHSH